MKKSILNLGKVLTKEKLIEVNGGNVHICENGGLNVWMEADGQFVVYGGLKPVAIKHTHVRYYCDEQVLKDAEIAAEKRLKSLS
ncbi:hypothetical protein ACSIGC_04125 [Tenacibaculum sp. ZS6-P6]|uniref:hypothetical protein n=1 Tax=Tenacibaculum sp. ZS6-P6 TaxID=3447503 RepID=UPI003F97B460